MGDKGAIEDSRIKFMESLISTNLSQLLLLDFLWI